MSRGPKGETFPADVIGNAVTSGGSRREIIKDATAAALGRKGGKARAEALSKK